MPLFFFCEINELQLYLSSHSIEQISAFIFFSTFFFKLNSVEGKKMIVKTWIYFFRVAFFMCKRESFLKNWIFLLHRLSLANSILSQICHLLFITLEDLSEEIPFFGDWKNIKFEDSLFFGDGEFFIIEFEGIFVTFY